MEFKEIIKRLRIRLSNDNNMQKIYNKDIAAALGLEAQYFAVMKKEKRYRLKKLRYIAIKKH